MKRVVVIIVVIVVLGFVSQTYLAQPTNLTDRELLIQLYTKMESIETSISQIKNCSSNTNEKIDIIDKRVSKNEINIVGFFNKIDDLAVRWNALLVLFASFMITIFVWMWKRVYNGNKK